MAFREQLLEDFVEHQPAGLIVALALFVLDHAALVIEHALADRAKQMAHSIAFHEQHPLERAARSGLEVIGAVEIGRAVIIGPADLLQIFEEILRQVFRSVEHQMLEQMGKAGLALGLVLRSDIVPHRDAHHRRLAIFMHQYGQAIGEHELLVRNLDLGDQRGNRRRLGNAGRCGRLGLDGSGGRCNQQRGAG